MVSSRQQIVTDASHHEVIRARIAHLRQSIAHVPAAERVLTAAAPLTSCFAPLVNMIDERVSDAITTCDATSKQRPLSYIDGTITVSTDKLICDAKSGRFFTERLKDMTTVGSIVRNNFEQHAGDLARLAVHATTDANAWWTSPVASVVTSLGSPVIHLVDHGIETIAKNHVVQNMVDHPESLKDLIKVDVIAYADAFLVRARAVAQSAKSNEQLHKAVESATTQLNALKGHLSPHADVLLQRLQHVADLSRQAQSKTMSYTDTFCQNFADAYGKTKDLTSSTIVYLDAHDVRLIPNDVYHFCRKFLGMTDRDQSYDELLQQFKNLFDSLSHVFALTNPKQGDTVGTDAQTSRASPIAA